MTNVYYGGLDTRVDCNSLLHPWRLVITDGKDEIHERQIRLPSGCTWLNFPRDPIWGNLLTEGKSFEQQVEDMASHLPSHITLNLHRRHNNMLTDRVLRWNGIAVVFHDIEIVNTDPLRIGGEAGCEIGSIMTNLSLKRILEIL
jgi:hypothetical protein